VAASWSRVREVMRSTLVNNFFLHVAAMLLSYIIQRITVSDFFVFEESTKYIIVLPHLKWHYRRSSAFVGLLGVTECGKWKSTI
jgi:hypothetical protein